MKSLAIKHIPYDGPLSNEDTVHCTSYIEMVIGRGQALDCRKRSFFIPEGHRRRGRRWKNEAVRKKVPQCETSTCVSSSLHTAVIK